MRTGNLVVLLIAALLLCGADAASQHTSQRASSNQDSDTKHKDKYAQVVIIDNPGPVVNTVPGVPVVYGVSTSPVQYQTPLIPVAPQPAAKVYANGVHHPGVYFPPPPVQLVPVIASVPVEQISTKRPPNQFGGLQPRKIAQEDLTSEPGDHSDPALLEVQRQDPELDWIGDTEGEEDAAADAESVLDTESVTEGADALELAGDPDAEANVNYDDDADADDMQELESGQSASETSDKAVVRTTTTTITKTTSAPSSASGSTESGASAGGSSGSSASGSSSSSESGGSSKSASSGASSSSASSKGGTKTETVTKFDGIKTVSTTEDGHTITKTSVDPSVFPGMGGKGKQTSKDASADAFLEYGDLDEENLDADADLGDTGSLRGALMRAEVESALLDSSSALDHAAAVKQTVVKTTTITKTQQASGASEASSSSSSKSSSASSSSGGSGSSGSSSSGASSTNSKGGTSTQTVTKFDGIKTVSTTTDGKTTTKTSIDPSVWPGMGKAPAAAAGGAAHF